MHWFALDSNPRKLRSPREAGGLWKSQPRLPIAGAFVRGGVKLRAQASVCRAK